MFITFIALTVAAASLLLILGGLDMVARDTLQTLRDAATRARQAGETLNRAAFALLWAMIFALSYF